MPNDAAGEKNVLLTILDAILEAPPIGTTADNHYINLPSLIMLKNFRALAAAREFNFKFLVRLLS